LVTDRHSVDHTSVTSLRFAVSTMVFGQQPLEETIPVAVAHDLMLEFSSGLGHHHKLENLYRTAGCARLPHNYFPAPEEPFLLNLASLNDQLWQRSIDHCHLGLDLASCSGAPFFSAHAGYCGDPSPDDLGNVMTEVHPELRQEYWGRFLDAVKHLGAEAAQANVKFLIENHVVIEDNVAAGDHPFLCATSEEALSLKEEAGPSVGLLLDTGHLKVTANSLGFDRDAFVEEVAGVVECIHHSDNDGIRDTNQALSLDYWFLRHMRKFGDVLHVLETRPMSLEDIFSQRSLLSSAAGLDPCK